ncbi:MAG TPA: hypothetical protein VJV03_05545 [Pyrinomonadaceae bacterium]|nr:hypothetical protein [Pyrinomonadaceae bacterium]
MTRVCQNHLRYGGPATGIRAGAGCEWLNWRHTVLTMIIPKISSKPALAQLALLLCATFLVAGCSTFASRANTGVVVSQRAQIRSSTAVVAADLLEVSRGDAVEILDSTEVPDPTDNSRNELWYRVRATADVDKTEGWIEARNIMPEDVLEKARKLAEEDKDIQAQATGQLHASSNLRLTPERTTNDNIMMRLDSGSSFEIVGWKRVPRVKDAESESDVAPKRGSAAAPTRRTGRGDERAEEEQEMTELWYKVRLSPENSPAPAGWIFGKQVELTVPSDIIYYRTGREFVAWRRLDEEPSDETSATTKTKDVAKESRPGSWVILERSNPKNEPRKIGEPDFDRIYVLGYEKHDQDHYTAYRSPDVEGYLPVRVEGRGANKTFTVRIKDESGQVKDMTFSLYRDQHGVTRVNPPEQMKTAKKK